jgi:coenzyme F420-dependent glucose-6-phosphate dehydrogenase
VRAGKSIVSAGRAWVNRRVPEIGYALSSEEHGPRALVRYARRAEEAGFTHALVSDHYHPWTDRQGQSPFVWAVIGGIAEATERLRLGTGVTCPTVRIHPAIIAQAAATAAAMMPGRFFLGLGSGETLNEHVTGARWPSGAVRLEMLDEAVDVIRLLWQGGYRSHHGRHYTVEAARIYTLPDEPPPLVVAAAKPRAAELAGRKADAFITTSPDKDLLARFDAAGGAGKARYGGLVVCWARSEKEGRRIAHEWWPNAALKGDFSWELPLPAHFEEAVQIVTEENVAKAVVCGPDPEAHIAKIEEYVEAGFSHVYVHQIGPDQDGFFGFYEREILPRYS